MIRSAFLTCLLLAFLTGCKTTRQVKGSVDVINLDSIEIIASKDNPYRASATKDFDLVHTRLKVSFDYSRQYLIGKAVLTLKPHFYPQYNLILDAKSFELIEVSMLKGNDNHVPLEYSYDSTQIKIQLDRRYNAGEEFRLFIDYIAKPEERVTGGSAAISSDKGLYFINPLGADSTKPIQIWTQGETESNSCWFPTIDKPNQKTTNELFIIRDKRYKSLSNGKLISTTDNKDGTFTDYWKQDLPHAPYLLMMAVGDFSVIEAQWRDVPVSYYVEKQYSPYAGKIFGNTPEMMEFFSQKLGFDYPWAKYAQVVVRDYVSGAMENTSATLHSEILQRNNRDLIDETYEDYISHELFHQWFGDLVTCESWSNIPLNESFATYGEYLWNDYKYGKEVADFKRYQNFEKYKEEAETKNVDLIRFYYEDREDMFDRHSYEKGGLLLHYLRSVVGDDAFFKSLSLYLKTNQFKSVEIHQLRLAFEEVTGRDLNPFFNQWFLNKGHPILNIETSYARDSIFVSLTQKHNTEDDFFYTLPLKIDFWFGKETQTEYFELNKAKQTFAWPASRQPSWVDVDPDRNVVGERKEVKNLSTLIFQYQNSKSIIAQYEALMALTEKQKEFEEAKSIVRQAVVHPFYAMRALAVQKMILPADNAESVYTILDSVAQDDKNSHVRAAAIERLGESSWSKKYVSLFTKMVGDSSYLVSAESLEALSSANSTKAMEIASGLEQETNVRITNAVAFVYAANGSENEQQFFEKKLRNSSTNKYSMVYYYANFLSRMDKSRVLQGIATLEKTASESTDYLTIASRGALKRVAKYFEEKKKKVQTDLAVSSDAASKATLNELISNYDEIIAAATDAVGRVGKK